MTRKINLILHSEAYVNIYIKWKMKITDLWINKSIRTPTNDRYMIKQKLVNSSNQCFGKREDSKNHLAQHSLRQQFFQLSPVQRFCSISLDWNQNRELTTWRSSLSLTVKVTSPNWRLMEKPCCAKVTFLFFFCGNVTISKLNIGKKAHALSFLNFPINQVTQVQSFCQLLMSIANDRRRTYVASYHFSEKMEYRNSRSIHFPTFSPNFFAMFSVSKS